MDGEELARRPLPSVLSWAAGAALFRTLVWAGMKEGSRM